MLATSLSLVVIFLPIAFMGGIVGRFFSSFGLTVAFAVMMSLFVSFTLTPMLCSRFLKLEPVEPGHGTHRPRSKSGFVYRLIDGAYGLVLRSAMRHKFLVVLLTFVVIAGTVPIGRIMGVSLIPRDDQSEYEVTVTTPEGYSLERSGTLLAELESADLAALGDPARLHDRRPDRRRSRGQGRGRRHPRDDLCADHGPRGTRVRDEGSRPGGTCPARSAQFWNGPRIDQFAVQQ